MSANGTLRDAEMTIRFTADERADIRRRARAMGIEPAKFVYILVSGQLREADQKAAGRAAISTLNHAFSGSAA